ncbi:MAG TPA: hypothetical protein VGA56_23785 [Opitutaceae bacterium]
MSKRTNKLRYLYFFLGWTLGITAGGAIIGAISFPLVGSLLGAEGSSWELTLSGARDLAFLAFIWAPGTAIVLCFHRIYRDRQDAARHKRPEDPGASLL